LWHKIFGSPVQPAERVAETPVTEPAAPSDLRDEPREAGTGFADAHVDEPLLMDEEFAETTRDETSFVTEESAPTERRRERPQRGRGRGRGRRPADRHAGSRRREESYGERADAEPDDEFLDDRLMEDDEDSHAEAVTREENGNGAASEASESRAAALQRSIPSWEDAIGFIVDSNLQTRSERRPPRPGPRDGSSRGRSRGRRKS
jgi:hypothetical protein